MLKMRKKNNLSNLNQMPISLFEYFLEDYADIDGPNDGQLYCILSCADTKVHSVYIFINKL